jgi:Rod binding domain-containing protein
MSAISNLNVNLVAPPNVPASLRAADTDAVGRLHGPSTDGKDELREAFTQFVGETFFGQMIKAMRSTVGKPAYFYGGQAEEAFRGQLDQKLAEHMTKASADRFAEPLFHRQFPKLATEEDAHRVEKHPAFDQLQQLSRR